MSDRYIQHQAIEGYSSVVVLGWAPLPSVSEVMAKVWDERSDKIRETVVCTNPFLRHLMAK